ncbi:MAG TPA: 7-cyano-7-deazaguanine synthase, partial [Woeseiaceae bacterium]
MKTECEKNPVDQRALVLLSGGQDSTTCLYWAIDRFGRNSVITLSFDYGQRHRIELDSAQRIADHAGVGHAIL